MATQRFDLIVIGTGSAASAVAFPCRSAGWSVAVVDSQPFGGTCALRGCDPKKVLVGAAETIDRIHRMQGHGVRANGVGIDWADLMRFKRTFTDPVPQRREESFARADIAAFHGRAAFAGPAAIRVGDDTLHGRYVLVAAGAHPIPLDIPGADHVTFSDQFLELNELPSRLVFVGGGYVSFEFAHVAVRAGARATILHRGTRPLEHFDADLVDRLGRRTRDLGIDLELETEVKAIEPVAGGLRVHATAKGRAMTFEADMVVHGAGRVPAISELNLESAGVRFGKAGVEVNEYLQSVSNPAVYAAGDAAAGGPPLTPVAGSDGEIVAANLLKGNYRKTDYRSVPSVVFTVPPLAAAGLTEQQARDYGLQFRTYHESTSTWYSSRRLGEPVSAFKVLVEDPTKRILGAHLLGPHAEEVINLFAVAIQFGLTAKDLASVKYAYPTHASDIRYMVGEE